MRLFLHGFVLWAGLVSFSSQGEGPSSKKTLTYRIRGELQTLDWNRAQSYIEGSLLLNLMEGLVAIDDQLKVVPALAQQWTLSNDQKTYTFQLQENVKWSDGVSLQAQHFYDGWKRLLSPVTAAPYAYYLFDIEGAEAYSKGTLTDFSKVGIQVLNPWTLQVTLRKALPYWIQILAFWSTFPIRKDLIDQAETSWTHPGQLITLGPFVLLAHDLGSSYTLMKNPSYWRSRGNLDELIARIVEDDTKAIALFQNGQLNFLHDLSVVHDTALKASRAWHSFQRLKTIFLGFNTQKPPLDLTPLRKAIALSLQKEKLCRILSSEHLPATSFVAPPIAGYSKQVGHPYNPALGRKILEQTGLRQSGWDFQLSYLLPDWEKTRLLASQIQQDLKNNLGINLNLQFLENKTYRSRLALHTTHLYDFSWTADYPDASSFLGIYLSSSGNGGSPWKNLPFDQAYEPFLGLSPPEKRAQEALGLQRLLLEEETVQVPLCYEPNLALIHPSVSGYKLNGLDFIYFRTTSLGD